MCPLDSWNSPKQCFQDSHQFMYISNFITLTDIYFCILSIKKLQTNGRFAGSFIYALYVLMLSQTNYLQFSESSFAPGLHVMFFFVSVLDSAIIDEKFQLACEYSSSLLLKFIKYVSNAAKILCIKCFDAEKLQSRVKQVFLGFSF